MFRILLFIVAFFNFLQINAQTNPAITTWLQNTTNTGSYYIENNSTAIDINILYNCQKVEYSTDYVYVTATGIPAYPTGPFLDNNPSLASNQNAIFKLPLNPMENTGTKTATSAGNVGIFINGVALFDYRDGVAWNPTTNALCGGPGNAPCPGGPMATQDWNRDAIPAEREGFDCSKGHPANGNYHHHQNPSAFKLDKEVTSTICNLYDADGLYMIDETQHSPLIGFAYDGFPIYGAYSYTNVDGTGGISRMKSGYQLRNITTRTNGPDVSTTYFLGYFKEDYEFINNAASDYLDEHNGRFCVTPEYPNGTYAYFATVNENWTSAYPYAVGPTYYGIVKGENVSSITEPVTTYIPPEPTTCDIDATLTGNITSNTFQVSSTITATGQIAAGNSVAFRATTIVLSEGFSVAANADFLAEIAPCTNSFTANDNENQASNLYQLKVPTTLTNNLAVTVFPNPASDLVAIQISGILRNDLQVYLFDTQGQLLRQVRFNQGSTIHYLDTRTLYNGTYFIKFFDGTEMMTKQVVVQHE